MKKIIVLIGVAALSAGAFAGPCCPGWHRPPPPHHCGGWGWGRGGCNFWPGFIGGVVGGAIVSAAAAPAPVVVTQPTVVTQPVVVQQPTVVVSQPATVVTQPAVVTTTTTAAPVTTVQNVWVEGRYVDQVQPNGSVVRVWNPGHYEQRTVVVR